MLLFYSLISNLESELSAYLGGNHIIGVANATDALEILLSLQDLHSDDEVLVSTHTMLATASAVHQTGARPVPVDIDDDGLMCPDSL